MRNTLETRLGIFFAVALVTAAILLEMVGGLEFFKRGHTFRAHFRNVQELKRGDPVKMAGKQIGRVEDIRFDGDRLLVVMKITDHTASLRTDSKVTVKFSGLMGQNYVAIDFGTSQGLPAQANAELATEEPPDVNELMTRLQQVADDIQKITGNLTDVNLPELIGPFSDFLTESRPRLMGILTNAQAVTEQVASGHGTVGRLIYEDTLHTSALNTVTNLNHMIADLKSVVDEANVVLTDVRAGKGTLGKLTQDETLYRETVDAMTQLREIFEKINRGEGSAGKLVNDQALIDNANLTLKKVDKATEALEDQGPLTVLGLLINPLF